MNTQLRFFFTSTLLLCFFSVANAQLGSRYATLQNNFQNINPAAINHLNVSRIVKDRLSVISLQSQSQSIDRRNTISSQNIRYEDINPRQNTLFGIGITNEEIHVHNTLRVSGNFAYQIDLERRGSSAENQRILSLGGGVAANIQSTDLESLRYADPTDLVLPISSSIYTTFSGGAFFLYKDKSLPSFYTGISAFHNIRTANTPSSTQFFFIGGMILSSKNKAILFEPNTTVRFATYDGFIVTSTTASPLSIDAGLRIWYDAQNTFGFFGGANLGSNDRARLELGFSFYKKKTKTRRQSIPTRNQRKRNGSSTNALRIGYTYDFNYKNNFKLASISEIFITLPIKRAKRKRRN